MEGNKHRGKVNLFSRNAYRHFVWLTSTGIFGFLHSGSELKMAHQLYYKGVEVDFHIFPLCAALLHHFELVQYAG